MQRSHLTLVQGHQCNAPRHHGQPHKNPQERRSTMTLQHQQNNWWSMDFVKISLCCCLGSTWTEHDCNGYLHQVLSPSCDNRSHTTKLDHDTSRHSSHLPCPRGSRGHRPSHPSLYPKLFCICIRWGRSRMQGCLCSGLWALGGTYHSNRTCFHNCYLRKGSMRQAHRSRSCMYDDWSSSHPGECIKPKPRRLLPLPQTPWLSSPPSLFSLLRSSCLKPPSLSPEPRCEC